MRYDVGRRGAEFVQGMGYGVSSPIGAVVTPGTGLQATHVECRHQPVTVQDSSAAASSSRVVRVEPM
jgi:hypothetical protein